MAEEWKQRRLERQRIRAPPPMRWCLDEANIRKMQILSLTAVLQTYKDYD